MDKEEILMIIESLSLYEDKELYMRAVCAIIIETSKLQNIHDRMLLWGLLDEKIKIKLLSLKNIN
jgi:hypothetical protein